MKGEVYLPPTPLRLGPLAAKVGPESSTRTLYVYWGLTLVRMDQILPRGALGPLCDTFWDNLNLSELVPNLARLTFARKRAEGSLHGEGCLQDVQTALCTSANRWCANLYTYIGPMVP